MSNDLERSIKDRVREIAKAENRTFNDVWKTLVLERFLARLSRSPQIENLIFKGGVLLSKYIPLGRETVDLDFLAVNLTASVETIRATVESIISLPSEDRFSFDALQVEQLPQPHMNYPGYAVSAVAILGRTKTSISIDIGVGDVVEGAEKNIEFLALRAKPLFETSVALRVYPLEYIFAEKLETVIYRGATNSRMKDFFDLWLLLNEPKLIPENLETDAIIKTFRNRGTVIQLAGPLLAESEELMERAWTSFCRGLSESVKAAAPKSLFDIVKALDSLMVTKRIVESVEAI